MGSTGSIGLLTAQSSLTLASAYSQAETAKAEGIYASDAYKANARYAGAQAADAIARGEQAALRHLVDTGRLEGKQTASYAGQGVRVGTGSARDVRTETGALGALDALMIRNNAFREAMGYRTQAADYTSRAALSRISAAGKARNAYLGAGLDVLNDWGKYYSYGQRTAEEIPYAKPATQAQIDANAGSPPPDWLRGRIQPYA